MNSMSERKHIEWIDGAKGFAILLVIIGHCIDAIRMPNYLNNILLYLIAYIILSIHFICLYFL